MAFRRGVHRFFEEFVAGTESGACPWSLRDFLATGALTPGFYTGQPSPGAEVVACAPQDRCQNVPKRDKKCHDMVFGPVSLPTIDRHALDSVQQARQVNTGKV